MNSAPDASESKEDRRRGGRAPGDPCEPRDPIAIVGAACRLPGAAGVNEFWEILAEGRDAVTEVPPERFDVDRWYDPEPGRAGGIVSRAGGFVDDIDRFDAAFFGISAHAAVRLDPQQRLLMALAWEALEDAGATPESLAGTRTGVYTGCVSSGYWDLLRQAGLVDLHAAMGVELGGTTAGQLSYQLDLRGPSLGVEAACATSLLAVHLACRAIWSGEIDKAIVGGSNLLLAPDLYFSLSEAEMLSPRGRCRFGDAGADGYVRSEGAVVLLLKPLADALAAGDRVHATILGTAAVNNGRSGGTMIAPGIEGQSEMLRAAYADAGISPGEVDYVEAHGPGTPTGDHIELTALGRVLGENRPAGRRCLLGSAKSNLGHTEVAAGIVGLLKTALALRHRRIPATLHVGEPNPVLTRGDMPVELAVEPRHWPERGRPGIAGVSAFGLTGTNVHVVLGEAPAVARRASAPEPAGYLLALSARSPEALHSMASDYRGLLETVTQQEELADLCFSAGARRAHHEHRLAVTGPDRQSLVDGLRSFVAREHSDAVSVSRTSATAAPHVVFVFPGQGSQWAGMGRELLATNPVFAKRMGECADAIEAELGWSLIPLLENGTVLSTVDQIQPALWAMQVALAALWREAGVEPALVIGHSMGEIAAAVTSGALSVVDAAAVVCRRSALLAGQREPGAMWAVQLGERDARRAIGRHSGQVAVGVLNSDQSTVLSGEPDALDEIVDSLRGRHVFCRQVQVDYASHSPRVDSLRDPLIASLASVRPREAEVPMHSTAYDRLITGSELGARYWMDNLRLPVRFGAAVRTALAGRRDTLFVEISPHPVLLTAIDDGVEASGATAAAIGSLWRDLPESEALLSALGSAYTRGCAPRWQVLYPDGRFVPPPAYPWSTKQFWVSAGAPGFPDAPGPVRQPLAAPEAGPAGGAAVVDEVDAVDEVVRQLTRQVAAVLATSPEDIDSAAPLTVAGLDSLLAAKLRRRIEWELDVRIGVGELLGARSLLELANDLADRKSAGRPVLQH
ncbi:type I polyketide synthase [Amycolatopsis nigrescens]|uniref:type I polyketide synthase n=1 Tax=Amycolatopsis nigrescens TaxID=381445 RepID=UPI00146B3C51|nr:type I polyketide synthase [Amycolatopsis nigrescens]